MASTSPTTHAAYSSSAASPQGHQITSFFGQVPYLVEQPLPACLRNESSKESAGERVDTAIIVSFFWRDQTLQGGVQRIPILNSLLAPRERSLRWARKLAEQ